MTGPLSHADVESTLCGPFFSSPLLISVQPQALGMPDKICMCKNLSKGMKSILSVNSHILKGSFPTHFNTASCVADIVSSLLLYFYTLIPCLVPIYTPYLTILPFSIHYTPIINPRYTILLHDSDTSFPRSSLHPQAPKHAPSISQNSITPALFSQITNLGWLSKVAQANSTLNTAILLGWPVQVATLG